MNVLSQLNIAIGSYLSHRDCISAKRACRSRPFNKQVAAFKIISHWKMKRSECYVNATIKKCLDYHAFCNRFKFNLPSLTHFTGGIYYIPLLFKRSRFVRMKYRRDSLCPNCGEDFIGAACYYSIGFKMKSSTPFLNFYCPACRDIDCDVEWDTMNFFDCYQEPVYL